MNLSGTSVYKRTDSPYWWISYWCPKRLRYVAKSSQCRRDDSQGYKRALSMARELSADARAARATAPSARFDMWVHDWLQLRHRDCPNTLKAESHRWGWLDAFLTQRKVYGPHGVTYQLGLDYIQWRTSQVKRVSKRHPSHNTALWELRLLARIMREAVHRGYIAASPLERMGIRKDRAPEKPELTDADVAAIRAGLIDWEGDLPLALRWMTISFEIALHQGCRLTETSVAMSDIDEAARRITFHAKRHKVFTTQLHPALLPLTRQLRAAGVERTCALPQMASKEWHWFLKGRAERGWKGVCPQASFHCTRVTVITRMARAGVPIQQAMAFVGHADETVHRVYQRLQPQDLTRCTQALAFFPSNGNPQIPGADETKRAAIAGL